MGRPSGECARCSATTPRRLSGLSMSRSLPAVAVVAKRGNAQPGPPRTDPHPHPHTHTHTHTHTHNSARLTGPVAHHANVHTDKRVGGRTRDGERMPLLRRDVRHIEIEIPVRAEAEAERRGRQRRSRKTESKQASK